MEKSRGEKKILITSRRRKRFTWGRGEQKRGRSGAKLESVSGQTQGKELPRRTCCAFKRKKKKLAKKTKEFRVSQGGGKENSTDLDLSRGAGGKMDRQRQEKGSIDKISGFREGDSLRSCREGGGGLGKKSSQE